jgi:peptidoglycan-N-acetylglucosamine deacetylase
MTHDLVREGLLLSAVLATTAGTVCNAAFLPESQLFGSTLIAGADPSEVALTYDDGPNDRATEDLLAVLARHNVRATFFMIGRFVRERRQIAQRVLAAGHLIGNHTMNHPWLAWQSAHVIREELRSCNEALEDVLGTAVRYFRAPHGARRPAVLRIARELGLVPVQWNVMGNDWEPIGADAILANVERGMLQTQRRSIASNVLLHDGYDRQLGADRQATVQATDRFLASFAERGYRAVTVDAWG